MKTNSYGSKYQLVGSVNALVSSFAEKVLSKNASTALGTLAGALVSSKVDVEYKSKYDVKLPEKK